MLTSIVTVLAGAAVVAFPLSEILLALFRRAASKHAVLADRGSMRLLWIVIGLSVFAAKFVRTFRVGRFSASILVLDSVSLALILAGLTIRWMAILTLGRLFTVNIAIHAGHIVVDTGLYRYVRHPSYAGLLVAFAGLGAFFGSWLSTLTLVVPITLAILNRIRQEGAALRAALGDAYLAYCGRTRRLVPGIL